LEQEQQRIVLIGQGAIDGLEDALVRLGRVLDFQVVVIGHDPMLTEVPDHLLDDPEYSIASFGFSEADSVAVLTHSERDVEVLQTLSGFKLRYVGLLGNRERIKEDLAGLRARGVNEEFIASIRGPIGADIGARTPAEIALSIMTEVVATKYGKKVLRREAKPEGSPASSSAR
jgi:xanthine dehydrogenase accessory factor